MPSLVMIMCDMNNYASPSQDLYARLKHPITDQKQKIFAQQTQLNGLSPSSH
jgi:hypothetical protein